jgi:hypothetical protein
MLADDPHGRTFAMNRQKGGGGEKETPLAPIQGGRAEFPDRLKVAGRPPKVRSAGEPECCWIRMRQKRAEATNDPTLGALQGV